MRFLRLLHAILREIFDEAAYERFCLQHNASDHSSSYAAFLRERERMKNVKCC